MDNISLIFKALSDPTRLEITRLLLDGELCVCEIISQLRISQPKISRHLAYLKKYNLVKNRKDGYWQHYRLNNNNHFYSKILTLLKNTKTNKSIRRKNGEHCAGRKKT